MPWLSMPRVRYPRAYKWFLFFSVLDVVLTWFILLLGGTEVNFIADAVIAYAGLRGILVYKFCLVLLAIVTCEIVGRRRPRTGRKLIFAAIFITALPVVLSVVQLITAWSQPVATVTM